MDGMGWYGMDETMRGGRLGALQWSDDADAGSQEGVLITVRCKVL